MNVLVLNCGSSSLKFQLVDSATETRLARGVVERIGGQALCTYEPRHAPARKHAEPVRDHAGAVERVMRWLVGGGDGTGEGTGVLGSAGEVQAVGHRVVHGGESFRTHARIDAGVIRQIEDCMDLAPLHNPANLSGIRAARALLGEGVPMVAVFDTAFHSTMPETSYLYALPYQLYRRHRIRRYGFHGTSHAWLVQRFAELAGKPREGVDVITLHLGNGCSACAVRQGRSVATSMGFTPLEGLVMGTRCGDLDPSLVEHVALKEGMSLREMDTLLNKQSGLLGVSGLTSDMRELLDEEREHGTGARRWPSTSSCAASSTTSGRISPSSTEPRRSCSAEVSARTRPRCGGAYATGSAGSASSSTRKGMPPLRPVRKARWAWTGQGSESWSSPPTRSA